MRKEARSAVDEYRERQIRKNSRKTYVLRKLAAITVLVVGTLIVELLLLGGSTDKTAWQSALFWGGALWIGLGALGGGVHIPLQFPGNVSTSPTTAETLARDRLGGRDKKLGFMLAMMIAGAVLWLLALIAMYVI